MSFPSKKNNKVVLVTGASRGIGKAIALKFGEKGARVVVNYKNSFRDADEVVAKINNSGGEAIKYCADVSQYLQVQEMIKCIVEKWKNIDILINNAGIVKDSLLVKMSSNDWDEVINTNLTGTFNCIKAVTPIMMGQKSGHIINISSICGIRGNFGQTNYSASKSAILGLTKSVARELGKFKINVNAILPGFNLTTMSKTSSKEIVEKAKTQSVLNTLGNLDELSEFVVFLANLKSVSGQVFNIDSRII